MPVPEAVAIGGGRDGAQNGADPARIVADAELGGGNGELPGLVAQPQIAGECQSQAATEAEAVDHRNRGLDALGERLEGCMIESVVGMLSAARARGFEFGYVGASRKRACSRPPQHHDTDAVIGLCPRDQTGQRAPQCSRQRIHAGGVVDRDRRYAVADVEV